MDKNRIESFSLLALYIGAATLLYFVFAPFLLVLVLAAVFAILLHAPYEKLATILGGWRSGAALAVVALLCVFFVVPIFFFGVQILKETQVLYGGISGNEMQQYLHPIEVAISGPLQRVFPEFVFDINAYLGNVLMFISNNLGSLLYQTLYVLFDTFLMLLALFYFLRDGRLFLAILERTSPFGREATNDILDKMYQAIVSILRGTLLIVIIRSVCIWIAFTLFDMPNALLLSSVGGIIGAIPGLGTAFAFIAGAAYFYLQGNMFAAAGLALSGVLAIVLVDNTLTSYFFGQGLGVSSLFVLFSILGGIVFFGPLGFILGPLVLSVFLAATRVYDSRGQMQVAYSK